ncbi:SDR family oxidoreductase [Jatrophihabitans telluris]|uniref:SDR family oxidoreductase n=1 Tax=Jatrophihabitans telluris TaxID=2038343 RepID=A0ABY4QZP4_9ACTN|nr:SDR family oxidoreductase [Jatrophihabitans telluris]UQX88988.1 SDR family oxidoreductase [Jatrophihabitans telluris]
MISGGGGGIGRACSLLYAKEGATVAVLDISADATAAVAAEVDQAGGRGHAFPVDVSDEAEVQRVADTLRERYGAADVMIHAAIQRMPGHLDELPAASFDRLIAVGLRGGFLLGRTFGRDMIAAGSGVLVFIGSNAAYSPYPYTGAYSACKAALLMLAKSFALEWASSGVRSVSVSPGMVRTPMTEELYSRPEILAGRSAAVPLGRIATAEEIAHAVHFVASNDASYMTGSDLLVDGGFVMSKFMHVPGRA